MAEPLELIPAGSQYNELRWMLAILKRDFPDKYAGLVNQPDRIQGWVDGIDSGKFTADDKRDDIVKYIIGEQLAMERYGIDAATFQKLILGGNEGGINFADLTVKVPPTQGTTDKDPTTLPGTLKGGTTIRVDTPAGERWYQIYEFPAGSGQFVAYQFNDRAQVEATLGKGFEFTVKAKTWFDQRIVAEGPAEEVIGQPGNFQFMMDEIMLDEALKSGLRDPSLIGQFANNAEMQAIMAKAAIGGWTPEQIRAAQRQTDFWKNVLYPGIENFYNKTGDPEQAWVDYTRNVEPALRNLGYIPDADGTFNSSIKRMLDNQIDAGTFLEQVPIFQRAQQSEEFFNVLNQRYQAQTGQTLEWGDWFDLLAGQTAPEVRRVAEEAVIDFEAQNAGFALTEQELNRLVAERDFSAQQAASIFNEVNAAMLALGEPGLARGGLTRDDILSMASGLASNSGMTQAQIRNKVAKIAQENALFDEKKIKAYVGFTPTGTPVRPGLLALSPEGA